MNLKIVNKGKFIRSIVLVFILIMGVSLIVTNKSLSHVETKFKTIYVANGDTLWSIAKQEQETNLYYSNKNIRTIIDDIKQTNSITNSNLKLNQELKIKEL